MKTAIVYSVFSVLLATVILGCSDVTEVNLTDEGQISDIISELIWFHTKGVYGIEDTSSALQSPITPLYWYREANSDPPFGLNIEMNSDRDSAFVTLTLDVSGTLSIIGLDSTLAIDSVYKALDDNAIRYALFYKDTVESYHGGWRLDRISGIEVNSDNVTAAIDSVRLKSDSYPDTVYTDPLLTFDLSEAFVFSPGEGVSLWVYTNQDTAEVYFHSWKGSNWLRWQLSYQGVGFYSGVWTTPIDPGIYHAAFDVLRHETLWDDQFPYDSNVWMLPYVVE
jgi:hypothetical protein